MNKNELDDKLSRAKLHIDFALLELYTIIERGTIDQRAAAMNIGEKLDSVSLDLMHVGEAEEEAEF